MEGTFAPLRPPPDLVSVHGEEDSPIPDIDKEI